tara:strand:- start:92 stop:526 length:435 start_codon:yes stop_codon:yes gene_type:complete
MSIKKNNIYKSDNSISLSVGLHLTSIEAGFPSPADDHLDVALDLNEYLIKHPSSTFYIYVKGDSMINNGIYNGDIIIVDRSLTPKTKDIVVAVIDGEFTVKKMYKKNNTIYLNPGNKNYKSIYIDSDMDFQIWGVVTHSIHHCR